MCTLLQFSSVSLAASSIACIYPSEGEQESPTDPATLDPELFDDAFDDDEPLPDDRDFFVEPDDPDDV